MSPIAPPVPAAGVSSRLDQRLAELGLTRVIVREDGGVSAESGCRPHERYVLDAPGFISATRRAWSTLVGAAGKAVELWPGVWLCPLPVRQRRRLVERRYREELQAVLMFGPRFLDADQFRQVCDANRVDYRSTRDRIPASALMDDAEVQRLATTIAWLREDDEQLHRRINEIQGMSSELAESYEELSLLYKLSSNMAVDESPETFLNLATTELSEVLGLSAMAIQLVDNEPRLQHLAGGTFIAGPQRVDPQVVGRIGRSLIERFDNGGEPTILEDDALRAMPELAGLTGSALVLPLRGQKKTLGILIGLSKVDGSQHSSVDAKLCDSLANSLCVFLDNVMLYEDMHAMFLGTLQALTAAIDAKDSYTHGHSERVALMSRLLAQAAGFEDHFVERTYISALVHDVGKIGVPEAVLCKPGKLTDEEFGLIKMHPQIGANILKDIRQMQDLLPGVLHHHERWDGRGYPHGLAGEDIPLMGRVIGLADAFDAMSSNRTYRKALKLDDVLEEIERCAGAQFDPELAKKFVKLDFGPFFEMIRKHQRREESESKAA